MVFSSVLFILIFLPFFLLAYYLANPKYKNLVILIGSILFNAWGTPKYILLIFTSLILNFYVIKQMYKHKNYSKILMILSIVINLGVLAYFKYFNFFIDNINLILSLTSIHPLSWVRLALPVGISFFTFHSISYTVDVYRDVHKPLDKLSDYAIYLLMFPHLIAGPIIRFSTIADDIVDRKHKETAENKLLGFYRFSIGIGKKVLIANIIGETVDKIYALPINELSSQLAWIAIIGYSFQIYFDFSGYSDMAIGLARMMGFRFPENFNMPYVSKSITEFWRRWHMTLGDWMRDYLYIPLGGNRVKSQARLYFNLAIVFLLSGLWHGSSWNFIFWGAWHGLFLILDRVFLLNLYKKIGAIPSMLITYFIVLIGWLFFRVEGFMNAINYLKIMFSCKTSFVKFPINVDFWFVLILAILISLIGSLPFGEKLKDIIYPSNLKPKTGFIYFLATFILLLVGVSLITATGFNPFIYFRF
ncbi:MBOAT family protein [Flavobacterium psychrophilum]|nr:MBOAT family protein [Flavobacterium psychrophilum]